MSDFLTQGIIPGSPNFVSQLSNFINFDQSVAVLAIRRPDFVCNSIRPRFSVRQFLGKIA